MATSDQVDTAAGVNALGPKKVQKGDDIIEQHSIDEQIKLSKYLEERANAAGSTTVPGFGLRFTRIIGTAGGGG